MLTDKNAFPICTIRSRSLSYTDFAISKIYLTILPKSYVILLNNQLISTFALSK